MNYNEAIEYLNSRAKFGERSNLNRVKNLMHYLGNPQDKLNYVHIAGTNGKGSTSSFCFSMLKEAGYNVGLFTSPYVQKFNERIQTSNGHISDDDVAQIIKKIHDIIKRNFDEDNSPTWFECLTAMGFVYFDIKKCEVVVLEVGIGGTIDSTNIIKTPYVSVITTINYDHMELLGNTLEEIAEKKAGIIKENGTAVVYPQCESVLDVFRNKCKEINTKIIEVSKNNVNEEEYNLNGIKFTYKDYNLQTKMLGKYQMYNASVAVEAIEVLRSKGFIISKENILNGILKSSWPGRMEIVNNLPLLIIDGAHNIQGTLNLVTNLKVLCPNKKFVFIVGVLSKKDYKSMIEPFFEIAKEFVTVTPRVFHSEGLLAEDLANDIKKLGYNAKHASSIEIAIQMAISIADENNCHICAFGSLYYIGLIRDYYGLS